MNFDVATAVADLVASGQLSDERPLWWLTDLSSLDARLDRLKACFPDETLHCVAVKANTQEEILAHVATRGFGFEAASIGELDLVRDRVPRGRLVYDAPVKTRTELQQAVQAGVRVNADSLTELVRLRELGATGVGIRLNPGGRAGRIASTSTGVPGSKFGVDLSEDGQALRDHLSIVDGLHVHVGSQGGDLALLVDGVRRVLDYATDIGFTPRVVDIGGGLSVDYGRADDPDRIGEWSVALRTRCPELFSGRFRIVTELGRFLHARHSIAVSRVEGVKRSGGRNIAMVHVGADLLLRAVYLPEQWSHRISVFDPQGRPKAGPTDPWDLAGPLCFAGDLIARARMLPRIDEGDVVVVHDVGAYTLSMRSAYNSRPEPATWIK